MRLGTEKGGTRNNILTIYPIQRSSDDEYSVASQQDIEFFEWKALRNAVFWNAAPTYTHNCEWQGPSKGV